MMILKTKCSFEKTPELNLHFNSKTIEKDTVKILGFYIYTHLQFDC